MKKLLIVESSPMKEKSVSRQVTQRLLERIKSREEVELRRRDLVSGPLPHLNQEVVEAFYTAPEKRSSSQSEAIKLSDHLVDELLWADYVILAVPMWNYGIPSSVKAWIDHIVRVRRTFTFTDEGVEGHVKGKKCFLVLSSGAVFSAGPYMPHDFQLPYLKMILAFIGMTDLVVIRAEGVKDSEVGHLLWENVERQLAEV